MSSQFSPSDHNHFHNLEDTKSSDLKDDCFELLSAYLDGEVTPQERQQVQQWLDNDPEIKKIYLQLQQLHHDLENLVVPTPIPAEQLSTQVFEQLERRQRWRKVVVFGGGAVAALFLATVSNFFSGVTPNLRLADNHKSVPQPLMVAVAVNKPAVKIPKAAVSTQKKQNINQQYINRQQ